MIKVIPVPDGFSVDLPEFNLVFNVSPFPILKPLAITKSPNEVGDHLIWVQLDARHFGLFERKTLNFHRCPTCGQAWSHLEENN